MGRRRLSRVNWVAPLAAVAAIAIIVALAFYVRGFEGTSSDDVAVPGGSGAPTDSLGSPSAPSSRHGHAHPHKHGGTRFVVPSDGPTVTLGAGGGGITITGQHQLIAHVSSSEPILVVGYLAPTSPDIAYGTAKNVGKDWTVHTIVSGNPKYALIWIYAGKSGATVTCSITIDGKVADLKRTSGPYGRQICYA